MAKRLKVAWTTHRLSHFLCLELQYQSGWAVFIQWNVTSKKIAFTNTLKYHLIYFTTGKLTTGCRLTFWLLLSVGIIHICCTDDFEFLCLHNCCNWGKINDANTANHFNPLEIPFMNVDSLFKKRKLWQRPWI